MTKFDSSQQQDDALRSAIRASAAAPPTQAEQTTLDALQGRILTQWETCQPTRWAIGNGSSGLSNGLLSGALGRKRHQWQIQLGFVALACMLVIGFQATQSGRDTNIDDLLEPDVLALMAMGEL